MALPSNLLSTLDTAFRLQGVDLTALGLAWARALPVVTLVPAFGLKALPSSARAVLALTLGLVIMPQTTVPTFAPATLPLPLTLIVEVLRGLPIAISAAMPLWAATQAGGLIDNLRGSAAEVSLPIVDGKSTSLGVLYGLVASGLFLTGGGPARCAQALAESGYSPHLLLHIVRTASQGITLSVAIAAPLIAASLVLEVASTLIARAAAPTQISALLAPLRSIGILFIAAFSLERVSWLLGYATQAPLHP